MKKILILAAAALLSLTSPLSAEDNPASMGSPKTEISKTIDDIIAVVEKHPDPKNESERRAKLRQLINPKFDFAKMAQLSLGANWNQITPEEKNEFVTIFSDLLAKTYLSKIETVKKGMVSIETETVDPATKKAIVKTLVKSKGDTFPIDYRLSKESGDWKVYDVVIENIGLVVNYRNEFAGIIRKDKFPGLMQRLKEKSTA